MEHRSEPVPAVSRFSFLHSAFRQPGCVFVAGDDRQPLFRMDMGEFKATTPIDRAATSLDMADDHPDHALLSLIGPALRFQRVIKADDPIPTEIIDGRPSWSPGAQPRERAVATVWQALARQLDLTEDPVDEAQAVDRLRDGLSAVLTGGARDRVVDALEEAIASIARAQWLRGALMALQRGIGDLALMSARRPRQPADGLARETALLLRPVAVHATVRTMRLDMITSDVRGLLSTPRTIQRAVWPLIAELRAMALDIEPVFNGLFDAPGRREGPSPHEIEGMYRLASLRYSGFDPTFFHWRPVDPPNGFEFRSRV